jgi:hypothetical protein
MFNQFLASFDGFDLSFQISHWCGAHIWWLGCRNAIFGTKNAHFVVKNGHLSLRATRALGSVAALLPPMATPLVAAHSIFNTPSSPSMIR